MSPMTPSLARSHPETLGKSHRAAARIQRQRDAPVGGASKRALDIVFASALLIFISPLMALIAALIWLQDRQASIFAHQRVGFRGRMFKCLKFRTMATNSSDLLAAHLASDPAAAEEWARTQKLRRDPRVTFIGAILRVTSLDEIPQLYNVLRGEMSVVGPRPVTSEEVRRYGEHVDTYMSARPGLTGLWQVSGRNTTTYKERVELDVQYVHNQSMLNDVKIIAKTIYVVAAREGAC